MLVCDGEKGPRVLLLAGRAWIATSVDWKRCRCFVELTDLPGKARWTSFGGVLSFDVTRGMRNVLLGHDPAGVQLSRRASSALGDLREHHGGSVSDGRTVLQRCAGGNLLWWTWAGTAANRTLHASLTGLVDPHQRLGDRAVRMRRDLEPRDLEPATSPTPCEPSTPPSSPTPPSAMAHSPASSSRLLYQWTWREQPWQHVSPTDRPHNEHS